VPTHLVFPLKYRGWKLIWIRTHCLLVIYNYLRRVFFVKKIFVFIRRSMSN